MTLDQPTSASFESQSPKMDLIKLVVGQRDVSPTHQQYSFCSLVPRINLVSTLVQRRAQRLNMEHSQSRIRDFRFKLVLMRCNFLRQK